MKLLFHSKKKNWERFNLNNPQSNNSINRMEVCTIDLILNLLLPYVVLTHVTTYNSEFTDSFILNC